MIILHYMETRGIDMNAWYPPSEALNQAAPPVPVWWSRLSPPAVSSCSLSNQPHDLSRGSWCDKGAVNQWTCCQRRLAQWGEDYGDNMCVCVPFYLPKGRVYPDMIQFVNTHQCHLSSYSSFIFSCSNFFKKHEFLEWFWDTIFFWNQKSKGFHHGPTTKPRANHGMHGMAPAACVFANSPRTSRSCLWATTVLGCPHKALIERCG